MKHFIMTVATIFIASTSFAHANTQSFTNLMSSAWKTQQSMHVQLDKHDIAMVYGGKDVSYHSTISPLTAVM